MEKELNEFLEYATYDEKKKYLTNDEKEIIWTSRKEFINAPLYRGIVHYSTAPKDFMEQQFMEKVMWQPDHIFHEKLREWGLDKQ